MDSCCCICRSARRVFKVKIRPVNSDKLESVGVGKILQLPKKVNWGLNKQHNADEGRHRTSRARRATSIIVAREDRLDLIDYSAFFFFWFFFKFRPWPGACYARWIEYYVEKQKTEQAFIFPTNFVQCSAQLVLNMQIRLFHNEFISSLLPQHLLALSSTAICGAFSSRWAGLQSRLTHNFRNLISPRQCQLWLTSPRPTSSRQQGDEDVRPQEMNAKKKVAWRLKIFLQQKLYSEKTDSTPSSSSLVITCQTMTLKFQGWEH